MNAIDAPLFPLRSLGRDAAATLRSWCWGIFWAELTEAEGRRGAWLAFLKSPARAARAALTAVRRRGRAIRAATGVSLGAQFARGWWLQLRHGIAQESVYRYQLYHPTRWPQAAHFVQRAEAARLYRVLGSHGFRDEVETLADKRRFAVWCERHALPTLPVLLELEGGRVTRGRPDADHLPRRDLFSKQAADYGGKGAALWRHLGEGRYEREGQCFSADEVLRELLRQSESCPVILQHRETTHPALRDVAPSALCTARVMTIRWPNAPARLLRAVFRMSMGGATMDNMTQGGIVSPVDIDKGTLGPAIRLDEQLCLEVHTRHPDTGAAIVDVQLPFWSEARELVLRAHNALGDLPCVGWDVALLEGGAVVVEGNWNPGVILSQLPSGIPFGATDYARCFIAHLEARFPNPDWRELLAHSRWQPDAEIRRRSQVTAAHVAGEVPTSALART